MNVLKPHLQATVKTLLDKGVSQREINRKTGVHRKTIRKYGRLDGLAATQGALSPKYPTGQQVATGTWDESGQNTPPRPPASDSKLPKHARSACEPHREWIEKQVRLGRNGMAIYQDLVERFGFTHKYNSVKRFVRGLKKKGSQTV
jgi:transposase